MFYLYVDLCVLADVDIVASAINASTAIRLLYQYKTPGICLKLKKLLRPWEGLFSKDTIRFL